MKRLLKILAVVFVLMMVGNLCFGNGCTWLKIPTDDNCTELWCVNVGGNNPMECACSTTMLVCNGGSQQ